jgi:hypothetical protein
MYTVIFAAVAGFILDFFLSVRGKRKTFLTCLGHASFGTIGGMVVGMLAAIVLGYLVPNKTVSEGPYELVCMRTSDHLSGTFVWGTGSINSSAVYRVYVRNTDGSVSPYSVEADSAVSILEDPALKDRGQWTVTSTRYDSSSRLAKWAFDPGPGADQPEDSNRFRVPKGTVINDFSAQ